MTRMNVVSLTDNPLDQALLIFGIHETLSAKTARKLLDRGDITLARKFFMPLQDYLEYAELTPQGLERWTNLDAENTVLVGDGGASDLQDPVSLQTGDRLLFTTERVQRFVLSGQHEDLLAMTHPPYRKAKGLGGDGL